MLGHLCLGLGCPWAKMKMTEKKDALLYVQELALSESVQAASLDSVHKGSHMSTLALEVISLLMG